MAFLNRQEAGQRLAAALASFKKERPVILALPRGGVPVASEVAESLAAPLDLFAPFALPTRTSKRSAILVDDGIATGMTIRAAARATARRRPSRIVIAAPVASSEIAADLRREFGEVVCLEEYEDLLAIGIHYANFSQVGDEEVRRILSRHTAPAG